mmetsp:Transcript_39536/g.113808  ORF Transcript_39536/g.113808 Transcript_39536/m.113808 type:complete len:217 (+) Transcript_39536:708-1358(+)
MHPLHGAALGARSFAEARTSARSDRLVPQRLYPLCVCCEVEHRRRDQHLAVLALVGLRSVVDWNPKTVPTGFHPLVDRNVFRLSDQVLPAGEGRVHHGNLRALPLVVDQEVEILPPDGHGGVRHKVGLGLLRTELDDRLAVGFPPEHRAVRVQFLALDDAHAHDRHRHHVREQERSVVRRIGPVDAHQVRQYQHVVDGAVDRAEDDVLGHRPIRDL